MGKKLTFVGLYIANALGCSIYSVLPPYLPKQAERKDLSSTMTGLILCGYPITAFLSSIFLANYVGRIGKKRVLLVGSFAEFVATLGFSFMPVLDQSSFIGFGIAMRLLQGLGAGFMGVAIFAIIASEFADNLQAYLGILQTSNAVGFMAGPFGASLLYSINGFSLIFQVYAVIFFVMTPFVCFAIPADSKSEETQNPLGSGSIMKQKKVMVYFVALIASYTTMCYLSPTYSLHLEKYDVPESLYGIIFGLPTITYALTIGLVTKSKSRKSSIMVLGLVILTLSCFLAGPWEPTQLPHSVFISVSGVMLIGIGLCAVQLTAIPEMIEKSQGIFSEYPKEQVSDICSGIASALAFFAELFAPPLSGVLADQIGFSDSEAVLGGAFVLVTALVWLVVRREAPAKVNKLLPDMELGDIQE
jgi:MFS family permease